MGNWGSSEDKVSQATKLLNELTVETFTENLSECRGDFTGSNVINARCTADVVNAYLNSRVCVNWSEGKGVPGVDYTQICTPCQGLRNINQQLKYTYSARCDMKADVSKQMEDKFVNKLDAAFKNSSDALGAALNKIVPGTHNTTVMQNLDVQNKAKHIFSTSNINRVYSGITGQQVINADNIGMDGVTQSMEYNIVLQGFMETKEYQQLVTQFENDVKASMENESKGITDIIANALKSVDNLVNKYGNVIMLVVAGLAVFGIFFIYLFKPVLSGIFATYAGVDDDSDDSDSSKNQ